MRPILPFMICGLIGCGPAAPDAVDFVFNESVARITPATNVVPVFSNQPIFDEIVGKTGSHAAAITALGDGELLAAWYSYSGPAELDGSAILMSRRPAGGVAWDVPYVHIDREEGDGNPVLYSEGDTVWIFQSVVPFGWSTSRIECQRSDDGGRSWSEPRALDGPLGSNTRYPPVRTADGALLLPAYDNLVLRSIFFRSDDGFNWKLASTSFTNPPFQQAQPSLVKLPTGRLLAVMRNDGRGWLWVSASDDNGRSWRRAVDSGFPNSNSPAALLLLESGNLLLVYNDSPTVRAPLSVTLSPDQGRTWTKSRIIAGGNQSNSYPSAVQTDDGLIHIVYSEARRRIRHVTLNERWIVE